MQGRSWVPLLTGRAGAALRAAATGLRAGRGGAGDDLLWDDGRGEGAAGAGVLTLAGLRLARLDAGDYLLA